MNWAYTVQLDPGKQYTFGSAKGSFVTLPSHIASPQHAVVSHADAWTVQDLGSTTGTYLNGHVVSEAEPLNDRDVLRIATCEAVFQNPEAAAEAEQLRRVVSEQQSHLKDVVTQAELNGTLASQELRHAISPTATPSPEISPAAEPNDVVWVAQTLASIVQDVLANSTARDEAFTRMLRHLKSAINADNGFVMIPDNQTMRWIIRAWVGDHESWTDYEKSHPLPLTVTNRAYRMSTVVSNALAGAPGTPTDDQPINSASMEQLQVNSYVAVPLLERGQRRGVLYFDTRTKDRKFRPRDVQLLEMTGSVILQIEGMK